MTNAARTHGTSKRMISLTSMTIIVLMASLILLLASCAPAQSTTEQSVATSQSERDGSPRVLSDEVPSSGSDETAEPTAIELMQDEYAIDNADALESAPLIVVGQYDYSINTDAFPIYGMALGRILDQYQALDLNTGAMYLLTYEYRRMSVIPLLNADGTQRIMDDADLARWRQAAIEDGCWQMNALAKEV